MALTMTFAFLALEFTIVSVLLLWTYHLRSQLGLSAVIAVVASLQFLQTILAESLYWRFGQDYLLTPGSCIFFASNLAILLYAHARSGPRASRQILYGVLIANASVGLMSGLVGLHVRFVEPVRFVDVPPEVFTQNIATPVFGVLSLYFSQLLAIVVMEWLRARFARFPIILSLTVALVVALSFDSVFFLTLTFWCSENFANLLASSLLSKGAGGLLFGLVWGLFLQRKSTTAVDQSGAVIRFLLFRDELDELRQAAMTDELTGLYNRRKYDAFIDGIESQSSTPNCFALLVFDADNLKGVNDTLGHSDGDELLISIADTIADAVRGQDLAFRLGGDEFAVILRDCSRENAIRVAERITDFEFTHPDLADDVTLSGGLALFPDETSDRDAIFELADRRLYRAKNSEDTQFVSTGFVSDGFVSTE